MKWKVQMTIENKFISHFKSYWFLNTPVSWVKFIIISLISSIYLYVCGELFIPQLLTWLVFSRSDSLVCQYLFHVLIFIVICCTYILLFINNKLFCISHSDLFLYLLDVFWNLFSIAIENYFNWLKMGIEHYFCTHILPGKSLLVVWFCYMVYSQITPLKRTAANKVTIFTFLRW